MDKTSFFIDRPIKEYESTVAPKLLLISNGVLENDKSEIFDSIKGRDYLNTCFKSKFTYADTHVTYIDDNNSFPYEVFPNILKQYVVIKHTLDINEFLVAFIGNSAFEKFKQQRKEFVDSPFSLFIENDKVMTLKSRSYEFCGNDSIHIPYIILPDITEDYTKVDEILNNTNLADHIFESPYCSLDELLERFDNILKLYKENSLSYFRFNAQYNQATRKMEYFEIWDKINRIPLLYSPTLDNLENKTLVWSKLKEVLHTIPVYGSNIKEIIDLFKLNNVNIVPEEEVTETIYERPYFKLDNDYKGKQSEWYDKWHKEVLKTLNLKPQEKINEGYTDVHKYEWIYDIEVFENDWLFVAKSLDGLNKLVCWNDPKNLCNWIRDKILIGFNNAGYDDAVIRHALIYPYAVENTLTVKEFSDALIFDEENDVKRRPELRKDFKGKRIDIDPPFLSWDISLHLPFDIRRNSLKKLTMSVLNRPNYDSSVPFTIKHALTQSEREEVEKYCELDVDNTRDLFLPDPKDVELKKENPKHKGREYAQDSYDIKWNLIVEYKMKAKNLITKSSSFAGKVLCGENAKPNLKNTFKIVNNTKEFYSIPELALRELAGTEVLDFYLKNQSNPNYIKEKFECYLGGDDEGHLYQFGFGGLHQALLNYGSKNLVNMDVASLYPSLLIQYHLMSRGAAANPDSYEQVYNTRIEAKHTGKKLLNLGLKLVLNGAIGAMLSKFNPLYDTWSNSSICVHGQLLLFILVKRLFDAGFNIIQTNTDGIMIEKQENVDYMPIAEKWMEETRLVLEFDEISILQQNNVNNYYCQFTNGDVKSKGFYLSNEKFGKATSKILCNIVTEKPLLDNVAPRDFVIYKRHGVGEIYDGKTDTKLEGRSLAFVVGYPDDPRTQSYYSRSRNEREIVVKDEKGKAIVDENGNKVTETTNSISKITGFTDHMLLVDDINTLTMDEINTKEYVNFAKNLLDKTEIFGPYYDEGFVKVDEPAYLQALNPLKDNTDEHPTISGVKCQNLLYECDYLTKEEQEELIKTIEQYTYRITWSGHRSYHIIIRLNKKVTSNAYKKIWYYLAYKLGLQNADEQSNQPSKYTRVPGQINPKTGEMQTLYSENKYEFNVDEILEELPKLKEELKQPTKYKGQVTIKALERHIKRQDWSDGNRFASCQKLSPVLISQVSLEELIDMIPCKLEKDHIYVLKAKYHYWNKYKDFYEESGETEE